MEILATVGAEAWATLKFASVLAGAGVAVAIGLRVGYEVTTIFYGPVRFVFDLIVHQDGDE